MSGGGDASNLEQGGDVHVRPESRLGETETLVKTQWGDNHKWWSGDFKTKTKQHPSCKQRGTTCSERRQQIGADHDHEGRRGH